VKLAATQVQHVAHRVRSADGERTGGNRNGPRAGPAPRRKRSSKNGPPATPSVLSEGTGRLFSLIQNPPPRFALERLKRRPGLTLVAEPKVAEATFTRSRATRCRASPDIGAWKAVAYSDLGAAV